MRRRSVKGRSEISEFRRAFWALYARLYPEDAARAGWRMGYARSNTWHRTAHPAIVVSQYLAQREVGIYCTSPWGSPQEDVFPNLEGYEGAMRRELGVEIGEVADVYGAVKSRRVDTRDRENWGSMAGWLHEQLEVYLRVIDKGPEQTA